MINVAIGDTAILRVDKTKEKWKNGVTCVRESERIVCLWTPACSGSKVAKSCDECLCCLSTHKKEQREAVRQPFFWFAGFPHHLYFPSSSINLILPCHPLPPLLPFDPLDSSRPTQLLFERIGILTTNFSPFFQRSSFYSFLFLGSIMNQPKLVPGCDNTTKRITRSVTSCKEGYSTTASLKGHGLPRRMDLSFLFLIWLCMTLVLSPFEGDAQRVDAPNGVNRVDQFDPYFRKIFQQTTKTLFFFGVEETSQRPCAKRMKKG